MLHGRLETNSSGTHPHVVNLSRYYLNLFFDCSGCIRITFLYDPIKTAGLLYCLLRLGVFHRVPFDLDVAVEIITYFYFGNALETAKHVFRHAPVCEKDKFL